MKLKDLHKEAMSYLKNNFWKLLFVIFLEGIISTILTGIGNQFESSILQLVFSIVVYAITVPLSYGVVVSFMKASRNEPFATFDFVSDGMKAFKKVWAVFGRTILKLLLPAILLILAYASTVIPIFVAIAAKFSGSDVPSYMGIVSIITAILAIVATIFYTIKTLLYSLTSYILYDNPEYTGKEVVEESARMMKGNRVKYFLLSIYLSVLAIIVVIFGVAIPMLLNSIAATILTIIVVLVGVVALLPYAYAIQVAFYNLLRKSINGDSESVETEEN